MSNPRIDAHSSARATYRHDDDDDQLTCHSDRTTSSSSDPATQQCLEEVDSYAPGRGEALARFAQESTCSSEGAHGAPGSPEDCEPAPDAPPAKAAAPKPGAPPDSPAVSVGISGSARIGHVAGVNLQVEEGIVATSDRICMYRSHSDPIAAVEGASVGLGLSVSVVRDFSKWLGRGAEIGADPPAPIPVSPSISLAEGGTPNGVTGTFGANAGSSAYITETRTEVRNCVEAPW